jgi:hypothetical protein
MRAMTGPDPLRPEPGADAGIADIEADIDRTRNELGQTVEALSARLNVKERAREKVADTKANIVERTRAVRRQPAAPAAAIAVVLAAIVGIILWNRRR